MTRALWMMGCGLGLSGCFGPFLCGGGASQCPEAMPVAQGQFGIDVQDQDWLTQGQVEVSEDHILVTYETENGSVWEVRYDIVDRFPTDSPTTDWD